MRETVFERGIGDPLTTLTHTGFVNKISMKDAEITLTASWITDPLLRELR